MKIKEEISPRQLPEMLHARRFCWSPIWIVFLNHRSIEGVADSYLVQRHITQAIAAGFNLNGLSRRKSGMATWLFTLPIGRPKFQSTVQKIWPCSSRNLACRTGTRCLASCCHYVMPL
jgi:hypothetical protein